MQKQRLISGRYGEVHLYLGHHLYSPLAIDIKDKQVILLKAGDTFRFIIMNRLMNFIKASRMIVD
jgi:hypothetical protein